MFRVDRLVIGIALGSLVACSSSDEGLGRRAADAGADSQSDAAGGASAEGGAGASGGAVSTTGGAGGASGGAGGASGGAASDAGPGTGGQGGLGAGGDASSDAGPGAGVEPYAWYPRLDLRRVPFHAGSGEWGAAEPITAPAPPNITGGEYRITSTADWDAAAASGRRFIVPSGAAVASLFSTYDDIEIVIEDGASVGALHLALGSRILVRGSVLGRTGTGRLGTVAMGGGTVVGGDVTDVVIDGLTQVVGATLGTSSDSTRHLHRLAYTNMLVQGGLGILGDATDVVVAGSNVQIAEYGWILRLEGAWRRVALFENHFESLQNAMLRPTPSRPSVGPPGAFYVGDCTLVSSVQSSTGVDHGLIAEGAVLRIAPSNPEQTVPVQAVFVEGTRIHAMHATTSSAEFGPSQGFCDYYSHQGGLMVTDGPWNAAEWASRAGAGELWSIDVPVGSIASNPLPPWSDRNAAGDPRTLAP